MSGKFYNLDTRNTLGGDKASDIFVASQKAVKEYVDEQISTIIDTNTDHLVDLKDVKITSVANGQSLVYDSTTSKWINKAIDTSVATWGKITGTLSTQTDLKNALDGKSNTGHTHTKSQITDFPTKLSAFTDDLGSNPTHTHSQYITTHQDISGKQDKITSTNKLSSDLVDDTNKTHKFVTATQIESWDNKQDAINDLDTIRQNASSALHSGDNVSSLVNDAGYLTSEDISSVFVYKGAKTSQSQLPTSGNKKGDVWTVSDTGSEYVWNGTSWEYLGQILDLSGYQTKITTTNKLSADLLSEGTTNKLVSQTEKNTWSGKQDAISDLATIRANATAGKGAADTIANYGDIVSHDADEFAQASHTHTIANVTNLQTTLDGKQASITSTNKLSADLISDGTTNKVVTATEKSTWNNKQNAISDLTTIRANATAGKEAADTISGYGDIVTHNADEFLTEHQSLAGYVPTSRKINGKTLTADITLAAGDVGAATSTHKHLTSDVTALTGYTIATTAAAIASTDSLNVALGKLQKSIDGKQASGSYVPTTRKINGKTLNADITLSAGDVGASATGHKHLTSDVTALTGYTIATQAASIAATDSLNVALGKLQKSIDGKQASGNYVPTSRTVNGKALSDNITLSASDVSALPSTTTIPTISDTYSSTSSNGMSGKAVASAISNLATKATSLSGYGITDAYTKSQIDGMVSAGMHYKGTKASASALPTSGNQIGDLWNVTDTGANYAWDGSAWDKLSENIDLSGLVPNTRTINGKALSGDISLTYSDVGAASSAHTHSYVPTSRKINGKTLNADVTLSASDVGAAASSHNHVTSAVTALTGYTIATTAASIASTDSLNTALGKLQKSIDGKQASGNYVTTARKVNGKALSSDITLSASDVSALPADTVIPDAVTESTVSGWGFTKNTGTITGIKMNGASKGTSGVVDLGTVLTGHQTVKVNGVTGATTNNFGTCSTTAGTAAKTVTLTAGTFALETGARVLVKFTVTNTAANPTLNVGSTGAKAIQYRGSAISAGYLAANRTYEFVYDGTNYQLVGDINTDSNTTYTAGTGLTLSGTQFNHSNSVTAGTVGTSAATSGSTLAVPYVTYDAQGHITATGTHTHTVSGFVPTSRKINGKTLSADITLSAGDVGAATADHTHTYSDVGAASSAHTHSNYASTSHKHLTSDVTALTGYTIATTAAAIAATDSLNVALGKIQKTLDGKQASGSYVPTSRKINGKTLNADVTLTYSDVSAASSSHTHTYSDVGAASSAHTHTYSDVGAASSAHTHSGYAASTHYHATSAVTVLTGYTIATTAAAIASTDSLNTALGKLQKSIDGKQASGSYVPTSRTVNGKALSGNITLSASDVSAAASDHTHTYSEVGAASAAHTHSTFVKSGTGAAAGMVPAPSTTAGTTKYLREDGTWVVPPGTYSHPTTSGNKHIPSGGSSGQFLKWSADGTATWAADNNTLNTAGSTDTSSKIFLIGATSQAANPQTYSHDTVFVDTDGALNSVTPASGNNSTKVATTAFVTTAIGSYVKKAGDTMTGALTFANNTWNSVGDDASIGDHNVGGHVCIKPNNTTYDNSGGLSFHNSSGTALVQLNASSGTLTSSGALGLSNNAAKMQYNATTEAIEFVFA